MTSGSKPSLAQCWPRPMASLGHTKLWKGKCIYCEMKLLIILRLYKWDIHIYTVESPYNMVYDNTRLILGLRPANDRQCYFVTASSIGWAQTLNQPCNRKQVHLFMQEHEKRKPWRVIIPSKYQLTIIYTKCWLLLSHWDESILLSNHICIKSQQLMSHITNVKGT